MKCHVLHFDYSSVRQFKDDDDYNNGCDDDDDGDDEVDDEDDCGTMEDRAHTMQWPVSLANGPSQRVKH